MSRKCKMTSTGTMTYDSEWWETNCGHKVELGHWANPDNTTNTFKFCPFCGKPTTMIDKEEE